ncbi:uncharacterized protein LOC124447841 [Xenia sp. Carnegie-2017]|uniref:uncharacterized protein LOC124447841 n=1 Tax=Xenia sp. Carnegie-2017 TaxID=2897299 RepID=UPI001F047364|nr:uncharacterized protein LOC124447841 [Xenia sp. Carnegie-2017]
MMKFMKKNMIQSISTDAWDIGVFEFEGSLYFGLSQLGDERFRMFKWISGSFKDYQNFKLNNARNWSPFRIGSEQYFTVANYYRGPCSIFRYEKSKSKFVNETFSLECHRTIDVKPFHLGGVQYIAVANKRPYSTVIWRWNGRKFEPMQTISVTGMQVEVFEVNGETLLALSGSTEEGPYVYIYQWNGTRFEFIQRVFTQDRPHNLAAFEAGNEEFLAVTTLPMKSNGGRRNRILILKWSGNKFESFQNITAHWARRITAMSSPLMGKRKTTYLAIINFSNDPEIYYWVNKSSTKFDKLQDIPASMAKDISFFEMGNSLYMLMSSRKNIEIFRGEVV